MTRKKSPAQSMFVEDSPEDPTEFIPTGNSIVQLPSGGKLGYPAAIEYRDILVKDEEVLSSTTSKTYARTVNGVLKSICLDVSHFDQLCTFDRDYLLVYLWANNYSPTKEVEIECPHCQNKDIHVVDMTALEVVEIKDNLPEKFKIPLSKGKDDAYVIVRLNTVGDENMVEDFMQKKKTEYSYEHLMMVASIDVGMNIPFANKVEWIGENMTGKEMGIVRKFHKYFKFGVKDTIDYTCGSCSEVTTGTLPFHATDVLFPTVQSDSFERLLDNQDT